MTSDMKSRLSKNQSIKGVGPLVLIFMKRNNYLIYDFKQITLETDGKIKNLASFHRDLNIKNSTIINGIHIRYFKKEDNYLRNFYFFQIYLTKNNFSEQTPEYKFFLQFPSYSMFLKSAAGYLLHLEKYKNFNTNIIKRCNMVIQDDSGIPFHFFNEKEWNGKYYGVYTGQLRVTGMIYYKSQKALIEKYRTSKPFPLPFPFGYGVLAKNNLSNLIVLTRK